MAHALGIDIGSSNTKTVLVDDRGSTVANATCPLATLRHAATVEQDPEALWAAVVATVNDVAHQAPDAIADLTTVAVCSQYSSIVPVDRDGMPTAHLKMYLDTRGSSHALAILERHPEAWTSWVEHHGIPPVGGGLSLSHLLHFQLDQPDIHTATAAYLEPVDFVNLRLTGRVVATQCTMFTSLLCDNRTLGVTHYDDELISMSGIDAAKLPPLVANDAVIGMVAPAAATALGIPAGIPVQAGMNDSHAGAFATGAFEHERGGLMIGTTAVLLDTVEHMGGDLEHEVLSMPSPAPGHYLVMAENGLSGKVVEHTLNQLSDGADHFGELDDLLAASPAGARGILGLPWHSGTLSPRSNTNQRGAFLNLSLDTRREDLVRAAVEGTAHNLAWLLPYVEAFSGDQMTEIVFGGGAARSPQWAQTLADVLDRPICTLAQPEFAAARAVALVALQRAGATPPADIATTARYEPNSRHRAMYGTMQAQFEAAFDALLPISEALQQEGH